MNGNASEAAMASLVEYAGRLRLGGKDRLVVGGYPGSIVIGRTASGLTAEYWGGDGGRRVSVKLQDLPLERLDASDAEYVRRQIEHRGY